MAQVAREYGLGQQAVRKHRTKHLPDFLQALTSTVDAPVRGSLHAEYQRLYFSALDALAEAQAGTLTHIDKDLPEIRVVSNGAVNSAIREARKALDSLTRLAVDAVEGVEPLTPGDSALTDRMTKALAQVMSRALNADSSNPLDVSEDAIPSTIPIDVVEYVEVVDEGLVTSPERTSQHTETAKRVAGDVIVGTGGGQKPPIPLDAAIASETIPTDIRGISPEVQRAMEASRRADGTTTPPPTKDQAPIFVIPNPRYPGNVAASSPEERRAAGYEDLPITLDDLRSASPDLLAQLVSIRQSPTTTTTTTND